MHKLNKIIATGVLSTAVAGCSTPNNETKNEVSNILNNKNFGKNSISLVEKKSEKGLKPSDISANNEGFNVSVNQNIGLGMEFLNNSEIFKLEHKKVGEKVGTLVTFRYGEKVKSVLLTGVYNGINWSAKTTLGTAKIQNFNQHYLAAEAKKALTSQLFLTGKYETTITKGSKTLSVYEVEEQVTGGKQITKITKKLEGGTSNSWGVGAEYLFNNKNKISANYNSDNKSDNKLGASFSHLSEDQKILSTVSYNYQKAKQEFAGKVDTIVSNWGTSVGVYGTYSTDKNYTVGVGVSIPLSKSSSVYPTFSQKSTFHNLSHINENSAKYLQNTKQTTKTETLFIANPSKPNSNPEILTDLQNFSFEIGQNVNIKIEATDADGDSLIYRIENLPNGLTFSKNTITGTPERAGNYSVVVSVSDGKGGQAQKTFNIKITEKPVVNPTPTPNPETPALTINKAPKFSREGKTETIAYGTNYDAEANKPQANDTEDGVLNVTILSNNLNPNQAGTYEIVYEATDSKGAKVKLKDTIIVERETTPVLTINKIPTNLSFDLPQDIKVGQSFRVTGSAVDPENQALTYTWYLNETEVGTGETVEITATKEGQNELKMKVTDGVGSKILVKNFDAGVDVVVDKPKAIIYGKNGTFEVEIRKEGEGDDIVNIGGVWSYFKPPKITLPEGFKFASFYANEKENSFEYSVSGKDSLYGFIVRVDKIDDEDLSEYTDSIAITNPNNGTDTMTNKIATVGGKEVTIIDGKTATLNIGGTWYSTQSPEIKLPDGYTYLEYTIFEENDGRRYFRYRFYKGTEVSYIIAYVDEMILG